MIVKVRVFPRAKKPRVEPFDSGLKIYVSEPAVEGKANKKLIEVLAEYYHKKKRDITIIKGQKQRNKVVSIDEKNTFLPKASSK
ncbi:MAG: DUF167 domain-containing protein [Candidatus Omnitrophota bacterium]